MHHGLTLPHGAVPGIKGAFLGSVLHTYPSEMAQNFWTAIVAWTACFVTTIVISLLTRRNKSDEELGGLVYSLTPRLKDHELVWYKRPATLGVFILGLTLVLNIIFW
jgi:SSS family solute:Na+ symporter